MKDFLDTFSRNLEFNAKEEIRLLLNDEVFVSYPNSKQERGVDLRKINNISVLRIVDYIYQTIPNIAKAIDRKYYKFIIDKIESNYIRFKISDMSGNILTTQVVYKYTTYDIVYVNDFGADTGISNDYKVFEDLDNSKSNTEFVDFTDEELICDAKADMELYRESREMVRSEIKRGYKKESGYTHNALDAARINCASELVIEKLDTTSNAIISRCGEIQDKLKSDMLDDDDIRYITTLLMEIELRSIETKFEVQHLVTDKIMVL